MENTNFILKMQATYNQFTKAEKKVADFVLKNPQKVLFMSITDLADACKVGDTSVFRFCKTMKLQGYQEFKMKLSLSQAPERNQEIMEAAEDTHDRITNIADKIMQLHLSALKETRQLVSKERCLKVLEMMEQAKRICFFGIGDSLLTAEEARNKFLRITNKVVCITDPHMQAMAASMATEEDLIMIISYSGATKDNIHVAKVAKQSGAKIVSLTHFQKSPLTTYSDAVLLCGSSEGPLDGGSMTAKISQLYIIDLLYQEYYKRNYEECKRNNERTSTAVVEKLY